MNTRPTENEALLEGNVNAVLNSSLPTPDSVIDIPGHVGPVPRKENCFARFLKRVFGATCASSWDDYFAVDEGTSPTLVRVYRAAFAILSCCTVFYCLKNRNQRFTGEEPGEGRATAAVSKENVGDRPREIAFYPPMDLDPEVLRRGRATREEIYPIKVPNPNRIRSNNGNKPKEEDVVAV